MIARLDRPCHPSSYHSNRIQILGWIDMGDAQLPNADDIQLVLEATNELAAESSTSGAVSGEVLKDTSQQSGAVLESVRLISAQEASESINDFYPREGSTAVEAWLDAAALVPERGEPPKKYKLTMIVRGQGAGAVSNSVLFEIYPEDRWNEALGGFLYPTNFPIASDFLAVRGWAGRKGDSVESVELLLNGQPVAWCEHGLWSPEIYVSLPDAASSKYNYFAAVIRRRDFAALLEREQKNRAGSLLQARVKFVSGEVLMLSAPPLFWAAGCFVSLLEQGCGEIESVRLDNQGRLRVEGWYIGVKGVTADFELCGGFKSLMASEEPQAEVKLERIERADITERFLPCAGSAANGFCISFNPFVFGRVPGTIDIAACVGNQRSFFVSADMRRRMNDIIRSLSEWQGSSRRVLRTAAASAITSASAAKRILTKRPRISTAEPPRKAVLFASHNLSATEGAPAVLFDVIERFVGEYPDTEVIVVSSKEGPLREKLEALGVKVEVFADTSAVAQSWPRYHQVRREVENVITRLRPHTIYANTLDCFWAVDAARRSGVRCVWAIHECAAPLQAYPDLEPRLRMQLCDILASSERLVFVSQASANVYREIAGAAKIQVIPNGIDLKQVDRLRSSIDRLAARETLGVASSDKLVSIIGTTAPHKGQDVFLREMARLKDKFGSHLKMFVVGARRGAYLEALKSDAQRLGIEDNIKFVEETLDVAQYYVASDVIVVASRVESSSLVPLEAFAYQVPLVSTTSYGLREQIEGGRNAVEYDLDTEGSMSGAVESVLKDGSLREQIVREGRRDVENRFVHDAALAQHLNIVTGSEP
ncbi:MAG: glycosyltransferase family 4 protein [Bdellovibrionales bacterium]|nr:glycosyltransferase family 4 protein [Bdellovibrionales bacterium]